MIPFIETLFKEYRLAKAPGASVAVIREGQFIYKQSFGLANLETGITSSDMTNYRIASVTKQFTAMSVMLLHQLRLLDFSTPLTDIFPDFPKYGNHITIWHLIHHTSGLIDYETIIPSGRTAPLRDHDVLQLLKTEQKTNFPPGAQYRYSNSGYALLALIVKHYSRQSFPDFVKTRIFQPLGMTQSIVHEEGISTVPHRAIGYKKTDHKFEWHDQSMTSAVLGDGGIYTSLNDYFKWDQALYGKSIFTPDILQEIFTTGTLNDGTPIGYGFGWRIENRHNAQLIHHNGGTCGFSSSVRRVPEKKLTLVIFTNRGGNQAHQFGDTIIEWLLTHKL